MSLHKWHFFFTCSVVIGKNQSGKLSAQNVLYSKAIRYICGYFAKLFYETSVFIPALWTSRKYFAWCRENSDFMLGRILSNIYGHKIFIPAIHAHIINTHTRAYTLSVLAHPDLDKQLKAISHELSKRTFFVP